MIAEWIARGADEMGIMLNGKALDRFSRYHELITEANKSMNLTRVPDDAREAADRNYLDSLAPIAFWPEIRNAHALIDVGAGAGFPGIPLAIALPETRVTLIDAQKKRVEFLKRVIEALSLNAEALQMRAEDAGRDSNMREAFDCATARALAELRVLTELALPLVKPGGAMIAYKGPALDEELPAAKRAIEKLGGASAVCLPAPIPGRDWDHRLAVIKKIKPTPKPYPRRAGTPEKSPL